MYKVMTTFVYTGCASNWYMMHKCRYWYQCKSEVSG